MPMLGNVALALFIFYEILKLEFLQFFFSSCQFGQSDSTTVRVSSDFIVVSHFYLWF